MDMQLNRIDKGIETMKRLGITAMMLVSMLTVSVPVMAQQSSYPYYSQVNPQAGVVRRVVVLPRQRLIAQATQGGVQVGELKSPQRILDELKVANKIPQQIAPTIRVVNSKSLNAATNGRDLIITSALVDRLRTNDQRAFVISHELSHIALQHIGKTQFRHVGLSLLDALLLRRYVPEGSIVGMAKDLGISLYDKRSSRVYEYEADDLGIQLMTRAGYNPQAAIEVFGILQAATPGSRTPEFLQDHPITSSRIQALVQKYKLSTHQ